MKKYLITGILLVLASCFLQAQTPRKCTPEEIEKAKREAEVALANARNTLDLTIKEFTDESRITNSHYVSRLDVSADDFNEFANRSKKIGHKEGGDFDKWKKRTGKNAEYYMYYTVDAGKVYLYYEELEEQMDKQLQQYLPKGPISFDERTCNAYFKDVDFSKNHWQQGGNVDARLADMRKLAVAIGRNLGITLDPAKITFKSANPAQSGSPLPTRMYVTGSNIRNDMIGAAAKLNDDMTSIEFNGAYLARASISDAVNTLAEEVYHKYQMSELDKLYNAEKRDKPEKAWDWLDSFNEDNKKNYGAQANNLQKQIDAEQNEDKRNDLKKQLYEALHSYYGLAHEKDAKEFAGQVAAMEYYARHIKDFRED
jgi:hypothetical protein